jgi:4-amino-4-deoxy-L-arabinose transferase-like glycosyltransferase
MGKRLSGICLPGWVQILILLGFCFLLYVVNLGRWDLWNPDEPRYAQVAREMVQGGDWILMHFNGTIYEDKPPLFFWLIAFSSYVWQGFTSFAVRFPSALFGSLAVVATFLLGGCLYSLRTGFFSGLVLATSLQFAYLSTRANIDTTLTFFTTASLLCFCLWHQREKEERRSWTIYGFYVGMALATLTKGPVGLLVPLLVCLTYLIYLREWETLRAMRLPTGMALFAAIVLAWYLPAVMRGGEAYLSATLLRQTIDRYSKGWSHAQPIYYYLYNFPPQFLPWFLFFPAAILYGYSPTVVHKRREFFFPLIWFIVIFVFFSLSKGKRGLYLLPLYPAAALLVGKLWNDFIEGSTGHFKTGWISLPFRGLAGVGLLAGAALPVGISLAFPAYVSYSIPLGVVLIISSLAAFLLDRRRQRGAILALLIGITAAGFFYALRVVFPLVNPYKSARFLSQEVASRIQPGERLGIYGLTAGAYVFYTGIVPIVELETGEDLALFLQSSGRVYCFVDAKDLHAIKDKKNKARFELISQGQVGGSNVFLVSNR